VLLPRDQDEALREAKKRQSTAEFREEYDLRAGIKCFHAQGIRRNDLRRTRYVGLSKTRLQHIFTALALNLVRAVEWLVEPSGTTEQDTQITLCCFRESDRRRMSFFLNSATESTLVQGQILGTKYGRNMRSNGHCSMHTSPKALLLTKSRWSHFTF